MNRVGPQNVNPLIVEYLSVYESDVQHLALQAVLLAGHQGIPAVVEQMTSHVKKQARQGKSSDDNSADMPARL